MNTTFEQFKVAILRQRKGNNFSEKGIKILFAYLSKNDSKAISNHDNLTEYYCEYNNIVALKNDCVGLEITAKTYSELREYLEQYTDVISCEEGCIIFRNF